MRVGLQGCSQSTGCLDGATKAVAGVGWDLEERPQHQAMPRSSLRERCGWCMQAGLVCGREGACTGPAAVAGWPIW
jgi:hypothetical protein